MHYHFYNYSPSDGTDYSKFLLRNPSLLILFYFIVIKFGLIGLISLLIPDGCTQARMETLLTARVLLFRTTYSPRGFVIILHKLSSLALRGRLGRAPVTLRIINTAHIGLLIIYFLLNLVKRTIPVLMAHLVCPGQLLQNVHVVIAFGPLLVRSLLDLVGCQCHVQEGALEVEYSVLRLPIGYCHVVAALLEDALAFPQHDSHVEVGHVAAEQRVNS